MVFLTRFHFCDCLIYLLEKQSITMKFFISGNTASSKNSQRIVGKRLIKSKVAMRCFDTYIPQMLAIKSKWLKETAGKQKPLRLHIQFVRDSHRRFDYVNAAQTLQDCLVKAGLIADDNADELIPIFEPYLYNHNNGGVYVWVE